VEDNNNDVELTLTEEKAWALGVRTYLRKPLSSAELGRALEDIFASREES
jgi:YesN/AraC family two-component response regulator